jgi:hypothetical protein
MQKALFLILSVLSIHVFADINGSWLGWGEWKFDGSGTRCSTVKLEFTETDKALTRNKGTLDCDFVFMEMPELRLEKVGNDFFVDGRNMGHFEGNTYSWAEIYSENIKIRVELVREAGHIDYHETWLDASNNSPDHLLYEINARVFTGGK